MQRVIVTGAQGVLGSAVVSAFLPADHAVAAIDRAPAAPSDHDRLHLMGAAELIDPVAATAAFDAAWDR